MLDRLFVRGWEWPRSVPSASEKSIFFLEILKKCLKGGALTEFRNGVRDTRVRELLEDRKWLDYHQSVDCRRHFYFGLAEGVYGHPLFEEHMIPRAHMLML